MKPVPEFSRRIPIAALEEEGELALTLAADAAERAALARRFDCAGIASLRADVRLVRRGRRVVASVVLAARVRQVCVVSLAPFEAAVRERFELLFDLDARAQHLPGDGSDDGAEAPVGDALELGEPLAQRFALALPSYPRKPGAHFDSHPAGGGGNGGQRSPFAVLERLKDRG